MKKLMKLTDEFDILPLGTFTFMEYIVQLVSRGQRIRLKEILNDLETRSLFVLLRRDLGGNVIDVKVHIEEIIMSRQYKKYRS